jgi:hypothetical protein
MLKLNIKEVPQNYIIDRWRKNEKKLERNIPIQGPVEVLSDSICWEED